MININMMKLATTIEWEKITVPSTRRIDPTAQLYNIDLDRISTDSYIGPMAYLRGDIEIGDFSWVGPHAQINGEGKCEIGRAVGIGNGVIILTCAHPIHRVDKSKPIIAMQVIPQPVKIADGANIGVGAILLPNVIVGEGAQIGAGSVVTSGTRIGKYEIWAGNPAKLIGVRRE